MGQKILSHEEKVKETIHLFDQIRHQDRDLFSVSTNVPYFKLSDLYNWYPKIFNINNPVCSTKEQFLQQEVQQVIPAFEKVYSSHILNIKDDYTLRNPKTGVMEAIKKGNNQKLSSAICEYIFRSFDSNTATENTSIEQAYFLSQNKNLAEVMNLAQKIQIEHIRDSISQRIKTLHGIITHHAKGSNQNFQEILSLFWCTFYDAETMSTLRDIKNINGSPLYYMKTNTLYFMNEILSELEITLYSRPRPTIDFIKNQVRTYAIKARNEFKRHNTTQEKHLLKTSFEETPKQVKNIRKRFWKENYPVIIR